MVSTFFGRKLRITFVWYAFAMALCLTVFSQKSFAADEAIVVRLSTENRLLPLYLADFSRGDSGFDNKYLSRLHAVLDFDLSHNGMTNSVKHNTELDNLASSHSVGAAYNLENWKTKQVYYLVLCSVRDQTLSAQVISINNGYTQKVENIPLTGDYSQDRMTVHRLADALHKVLFNQDGIAATKILYTIRIKDTKDSTKWKAEVWEADYDGGNARQITHDNTLCVTPVYIPPKKGYSSSGAFLYVSYKTGQPKVYLASLREGKGRRFSYLPGNQLMPAVSLQRDKVCFISDVASNPDVFLQPFKPEVGALGKPRQIFTSRYATQGTPAFSPDGKKVAFVSNKDGPARIYVMDIPSPGTSVKNLRPTFVTKRNRENTAPAWSPDGKKIAYCAKTHGIRQIWVVDLATGEERQLTQGPGNKENPSWGPNSLHLVFNSADDNSSELYMVNLNQAEAVKISSGRGEKRFPNWEPRL